MLWVLLLVASATALPVHRLKHESKTAGLGEGWVQHGSDPSITYKVNYARGYSTHPIDTTGRSLLETSTGVINAEVTADFCLEISISWGPFSLGGSITAGAALKAKVGDESSVTLEVSIGGGLGLGVSFWVINAGVFFRGKVTLGLNIPKTPNQKIGDAVTSALKAWGQKLISGQPFIQHYSKLVEVSEKTHELMAKQLGDDVDVIYASQNAAALNYFKRFVEDFQAQLTAAAPKPATIDAYTALMATSWRKITFGANFVTSWPDCETATTLNPVTSKLCIMMKYGLLLPPKDRKTHWLYGNKMENLKACLPIIFPEFFPADAAGLAAKITFVTTGLTLAEESTPTQTSFSYLTGLSTYYLGLALPPDAFKEFVQAMQRNEAEFLTRTEEGSVTFAVASGSFSICNPDNIVTVAYGQKKTYKSNQAEPEVEGPAWTVTLAAPKILPVSLEFTIVGGALKSFLFKLRQKGNAPPGFPKTTEVAEIEKYTATINAITVAIAEIASISSANTNALTKTLAGTILTAIVVAIKEKAADVPAWIAGLFPLNKIADGIEDIVSKIVTSVGGSLADFPVKAEVETEWGFDVKLDHIERKFAFKLASTTKVATSVSGIPVGPSGATVGVGMTFEGGTAIEIEGSTA